MIFPNRKTGPAPLQIANYRVLLYAFTAEADGFPSCMQKNARKNAEKTDKLKCLLSLP